MEDMKEDKMKVLTQEEFDEEIVKALRNNKMFIEFMNVIVRDIKIKLIGRAQITIRFHNCRIESISCNYSILHRILLSIRFYNCDIVDWEKVECISKADISDCTFIKTVPFICPESGEFVGYKKCWYLDNEKDAYIDCVVKLLVPFDAKRSSAFSNKCRCSKVKVLGIFDLDGNELKDVFSVFSPYEYDGKFIYTVGEEVYPDSFDEDRFNECSHGIHLFTSFDEARDYYVMGQSAKGGYIYGI